MAHVSNGSEWSGINQYQSLGKSEPASPNPLPRGALATPPSSGGPPFSPLDPNAPDSAVPSPRMPQNPSPPSSVTSKSRVSDATLPDKSNRKNKRVEEVLFQHYVVLKRFLQAPLRDENGNIRSNKARDKLVRLSAVQFIELSTDVYDELQRRQAAAAANRPGPPRPEVPPHLMPRQEFHEKRNHARQKLSSLQHQRFKDLATDVFCELERRFPHFPNDRRASEAPRGRHPSGPNGYGSRPDSNGYPPRSQSRGPPPGSRGPPPPPGGRFPPRQGSLGAMPPGTQSGLGINGDTIPENAPYQKSYQNNTIVPNKSTMVEDDDDDADFDDDDDRRSDAFALDKVLASRRETTTTLGGSDKDKKLADAQSQVSSLEERIQELESLLKKKDEESVSDAERQDWAQEKSDLTGQLAEAQDLNSTLQTELENVRRHQESMERELQQHIEETSQDRDGGEWKARFEDLDKHHNTLKSELQAQQEVTEKVRQDASNFLQEMKVLSEQSSSSWEREENLTREVHRLEDEVKHWKTRYERSKTQLRHLRSSSFGLPGHIQDADTFGKQNELTRPDGLVKDIHVTKFQMSIDDLLRTARSSESFQVLDQMKSVVVAVRHITQDIESSQANNRNSDATQLPTRAKSKVSATANNLITASKNFANSKGLSPVSLLDAAASHLSAAVIELIRHVKIRPTPEDELDQANDDDNYVASTMKSPGYFSVAPSQGRVSANESIYSAISSPPSRKSNPRLAASRNTLQNGQAAAGTRHGYGAREGDKELEELRVYLEDQTEGLVGSIQALVSSIRAEDSLPVVRNHIDTISDVVSKVISSVQSSIDGATTNSTADLRDRAGPVIELLEQCRDSLVSTGADGDHLTDPSEIRQVTGKLPPIAFQVARETKELVQRIDQLQYEGREGDDFS